MISLLLLMIAVLTGLASCKGVTDGPVSTGTGESRSGATAWVSGSVTYRERIVLTPGASLVVELRDVSLADAAAPLIASKTIDDPGQVPIEFRVEYNPADIKPRNVYSVSARIMEGDDRLAFINDTAYDVITRGNPSRVDMVLALVQPPPDAKWEGKEDGSDWRAWVEVPVPVISANLMPNEPEPLLRIEFYQSTIEGCARPGNKALAVVGTNITATLTLMQPPNSSWAIDCDEQTARLDEIIHIDAELKPGTTYRIVVNDAEAATITPVSPTLGHTVLANSIIRNVALVEPASRGGRYKLQVDSGRPSGSCTQYNGYEIRREEPSVVEVRVTHHRVSDPEARCTRDFPSDRTVVPLGSDFEPGTEYIVRVNGEDGATFVAR